MRHVLTGMGAGVLAALLLTLWSFLGVSGQMGEASDTTGFLYILTAFGLLGLPQVLYGTGLGLVVAGWARFLGRGIAASLADPRSDQRSASLLLTAPVLVALVGLGVGALHFVVTGKFVRLEFQTLGLLGGAAAMTALALAFAPLVFEVFLAVVRRIFPEREVDRAEAPDAEGFFARATMTVLGIYAIGVIGGLFFGYQYVAGLQVFETQTVQMAFASLGLTPLLYMAMTRAWFDRLALRVGFPLAGLLAAVVCFVGAFGWASHSPEMREATTRHSALVARIAKALQPLDDNDGDGFADGLGGVDCDDASAEVYPGAQDAAGNGIDEDCSGADAQPPSGEDHPSRKIVDRAIQAGANAAAKLAQDIPDPPPNLVVILIDTVRQDHLGFAGYDRQTSPNIDAIAEDGIAFMDAYAPSPHTPRSIPPLFFGRYASKMKFWGAQYNYPKTRPENLGLFEVLDEKGYENVGMSSHFYFEEKMGIRQGFDRWDNEGAGSISESNEDIAAPRTWEKTEPAIAELARGWKQDKQPFGLFVHFFEPHARWIGHDAFPFEAGDTPASRHIANYDSEIAFVDSYVGKVVDKLKAEGVFDDVVLVITSDHGEAFDEHGYFFHGQTLYDEIINVPLIIRVPGWFSRKVEGPVSLVDVAPTLLELWGYTIPADFQGTSLVESMMGRAEVPDRPVFAELLPYTSWKEHHTAVIDGDEKFIKVFTTNTEEYYDLAEDPGEQTNIAAEKPEAVERLRKLVEEFRQK